MSRTQLKLAVAASVVCLLPCVRFLEVDAQSPSSAPSPSSQIDPMVVAAAETVFYKIGELGPKPVSPKTLAEQLPKLYPDLIRASLDLLVSERRIIRHGKGTGRSPYLYSVRRVTRQGKRS